MNEATRKLKGTDQSMNHVLSTHLLVNHRLNTVWLDKVGSPGTELEFAL